MTHPLVTQLRFTRGEWIRGLKPVTAAEATRRFAPINPIAPHWATELSTKPLQL